MPEEKYIREMFGSIAGKYDRANAALSFGIYKNWYKQVIRHASLSPGSKILDCATGTGNLAIAFRKKLGEHYEIHGIDFTSEMIDIAMKRSEKGNFNINFSIGNALDLDFNDDYFDLSLISFGIRNVESIEKCLLEMSRVVRQGGKLIVLEFGPPVGFMKFAYKIYQKIIPRLGSMITGNKNAYDYLKESSSKFPAGEEFVEIMNQTGRFKSVACYPLTGGIAWLYIGIVN